VGDDGAIRVIKLRYFQSLDTAINLYLLGEIDSVNAGDGFPRQLYGIYSQRVNYSPISENNSHGVRAKYSHLELPLGFHWAENLRSDATFQVLVCLICASSVMFL